MAKCTLQIPSAQNARHQDAIRHLGGLGIPDRAWRGVQETRMPDSNQRIPRMARGAPQSDWIPTINGRDFLVALRLYDLPGEL
jgi:hypothetical protein